MLLCVCVDSRTNSDYIPLNHCLIGFLPQKECLLRGINKSLNTVQLNLGLYMVNRVQVKALYDGKFHKFESLAGI